MTGNSSAASQASPPTPTLDWVAIRGRFQEMFAMFRDPGIEFASVTAEAVDVFVDGLMSSHV